MRKFIMLFVTLAIISYCLCGCAKSISYKEETYKGYIIPIGKVGSELVYSATISNGQITYTEYDIENKDEYEEIKYKDEVYRVPTTASRVTIINGEYKFRACTETDKDKFRKDIDSLLEGDRLSRYLSHNDDDYHTLW